MIKNKVLGDGDLQRLLAIGLLAIGLTACGDTQRGDLVEEYSKSVISLGMRPVYPPREDLQVGDIILASVPRTERNVVALAKRNPNDYVFVHLGNDPNVARLAQKYLRDRVVLQRTNGLAVADDNKPSSENQQDDLYDGVLSTRSDRVISTLPIVAFPEISADAGAGVGLGIVRALSAIGLAGSGRTTVKLNFSEVRSLRAPENQALFASKGVARNLFNKIRDDDTARESITGRFFVELANLVQGRDFRGGQGSGKIKTDFQDRCYRLVVITEVFLARRIDYTYSNAQIVSAALKNARPTATPSATNDVSTVNPVVIQLNTTNPGGSSGTAGGTTLRSTDAQSVQESALQAINRSQAGDSLTFQSWDALGVRFSRIYERPVTIGWRGFDFAADTSLLERELPKDASKRLSKEAFKNSNPKERFQGNPCDL